jgi:transcriptional regulator with XRE-family HTH domain
VAVSDAKLFRGATQPWLALIISFVARQHRAAIVPSFDGDASEKRKFVWSLESSYDCRVPKPSGKMNERERAVCARVKLAREDIKWPQSDFAQKIGLTKDKFASIEYGRTPLRYKTGVDLCEVFGVSAEWLIAEQGPMHGGTPVLWEVEFPFEHYGKKLFTEVYDLSPDIFRHTERIFGLVLDRPTPGFNAEAYLIAKVSRWFKRMKFRTPAEAEHFARTVDDRAEQMLLELHHSGRASQARLSKIKAEHAAVKRKTGQSGQTKELTDSSEPVRSIGDVKIKPQWPELKQRLQKATEAIGAKPALAKVLNVDPTQISQWLSESKSAREPGGDYALRMLKWVELQERQAQ